LKKLTVFILMIMFIMPLCADDYIFDIPGIGEVGIQYEGGDTYAAAIPGLGKYEFHGYINNKNDFDLSVELPTSDIVGYVPIAGQILGLFGVDTTTYIMKPDGLGINAHFEDGGLGSFRGLITDALGQTPGIDDILDEVIGLLEIVEMDLDALILDKTLKGSVTGVLSLGNQKISFHENGEISSSSLVKAFMLDLPLAALEFGVEKYLQIMGPIVSSVGGAIADGAEAVYREAMVVGHDVTTSLNHGTHDFNECFYECVPKYSSAKADRMLLGANRFTLDYYVRMGYALNKVRGINNEDTIAKRMKIIGASWASLGQELDAKWQNIYNDDEVENYFFKDSSERKGRDKHKQNVQAAWIRHQAYRAGIGANLLYINDPLDILTFWAQSGSAMTITHRDTSLSLDVFNAGTWNGVNIQFFENNCGNNQMWYLHSTGKKDTYYIQSASSGLYMHISGAKDQKGSSIACWGGSGGDQTQFRASVDKEGFVHWTTMVPI